MLRGTVVVGTLAFLMTLGAGTSALAQQSSSPCDLVHDHVHDAVIVFQPPTTFTVCHNGSVQNGVVTDQRVYLELAPAQTPRMFDYRLPGNPSEFSPAGLTAWEALAARIATKLRDLDHSGESIAEISVPLESPSSWTAPLRPLGAARARYLADVTPRYLDALHGVRGEARELPVVAGVVRRWCAALATEATGSLMADVEVRALCANPELREGVVEDALSSFDTAATKERADSARAREATLAALAHPDDSKAVADGAAALDAARISATAVVLAAHGLREASAALARDVATLHVALRALDGLRPGVPVYLSTYSRSGNAELEVDSTPSDISALGTDTTHPTKHQTTTRFPIYGRHYLDLEAGMAWTAGVPQSPYSETVQGNVLIQSKSVDQLAGLALVELEPARFLWPERPLAGLLRLPVIGIPFTRDPTSNFFVGAGVGWTGVGSLTAGPYIIRETTLRQGVTVGQTLPSGVPFGSVTEPGVHTGYYLSASIDLVGLFHLFVPSHAPTLDALTGKEK
jgi:hypothetical protein